MDTNIVIWMFSRPDRIQPEVLAQLKAAEGLRFVSTASLLEISSKVARGRLQFDAVNHAELKAQASWLQVSAEHAWAVRLLPVHHTDPFDRVLVAQAMAEEMTLVTGDRMMLQYPVSVLLT